MTKETFIRTSGLDGYANCARRSAAGLITGEVRAAGYIINDEQRNIAPAIGSSVHKSNEMILREKAESGKLPPVTVATDIAVETLREDIRKGVEYDSVYTQNQSDAQKQAAGMAAAYHGHIAPKIEPLLIEKKFEAQITWARENLVLSGTPDIVAREPKKLRDTKTGIRYGNHNAQIGGYELLLRSNGIDDVIEASIDFIQRVRPSKPQPAPVERSLELTVAGEAAVNILRHIDHDLHVWRHGDAQAGLQPGDRSAFVSNPTSFTCSARYCRCFGVRGPNAWCQDWNKGED